MTEPKSGPTPIDRAADIPVFTVTDDETGEPCAGVIVGICWDQREVFVHQNPVEITIWADNCERPVEISYRTISHPPEG